MTPDAGTSMAGGPGHPTAVPRLAASGISKRYGPILALRDVSLSVAQGEIVGLCGHNGAGKSTLIKVLAGLVRPDRGSLAVGGERVSFGGPLEAQLAGIALVDQEISVVPTLTVSENMTIGKAGEPALVQRRRDAARAKALLARVGLQHLDPRAIAGDLAVAERQLLEIARMLGREANIFILDEPTATLTDAEIPRVFEAVKSLAAGGGSVIFVSHRLDEVLSLCHRVVVMRDGAAVADVPSDELDKAALVRLMLGHDPAPAASRTKRPDGKPTFVVDGLSVPPAARGFSCDAQPGDIVGLAGQVGSGASAVLRAMAGLDTSASGEVLLDGRPVPLGSARRARAAGVFYLSGDRQKDGLFLEHSTSANLTSTRLRSARARGWLSTRALRRMARALADMIGIQHNRLAGPVVSLSGGNQQKVLLGRCLGRDDLRLLLLDEPTRGVDVGGREEIHGFIRGIADSGAVVVFASSELDEVQMLADVIITMYAGKVVGRHESAQATSSALLMEMTHADAA